MTRQEALNKIGELVVYARAQGWDEEFTEAFKALSAEPCEDTISFPKGTLKKRGKGYVVYNPEWLKKNWRTELKVMGVECEDTISRADAEALFRNARSKLNPSDYKTADEFNTRDLMLLNAEQFIHLLPSVTPKQKMGRWIPVSERSPEPFSFVNCTCHSLIDDREDWVVETVYLPQPPNSPYSDWGNIPMLNWGECEVIAWMYRDIPEPYEAESEDTE